MEPLAPGVQVQDPPLHHSPGMQVQSLVLLQSSLPSRQAECVMPPALWLLTAPPQLPLSGFPSGLTSHLGSLEAPQVLDGHLQNVGFLQLGMPGALREQAGLRPARRRRLPPHPPPRPPCAYILLQRVQDERLQLP